jgi:RNA polymerase sigma factor (sigma-70 family)
MIRPRAIKYVIDSAPNGCAAGTPQSDRQLVDRCLDGDDQAWNELLGMCQPTLIRSIRRGLGRTSKHEDLAQELVAQVWFALVTVNRPWLAKFDPAYGMRLPTYIVQFARWKIRNLIRAEHRRIGRVMDVTRPALDEPSDYDQAALTADLSEFIEALTPRELEYFTTHLIARPTQSQAAKFTPTNGSQLRHRILGKLRTFIVA